MKGLVRGAAPWWMGDRPEDQACRLGYYGDLRDARGSIRSRWNEEDGGGQQPIRLGLLEMSGRCCAYCGRSLEPRWYVDHYLPKSKFPRLAYCWAVLLPTCDCCNNHFKRAWAPPGLRRDSLVDLLPGLATEGDWVYSPAEILLELADRLVDPTFDDPSEHLRFEPTLHGYVAVTPVGKRTLEMFFSEKGVAERFEKIGASVRWNVERATTPGDLEQALSGLIQWTGCEVVVRAYASHWASLLKPEWGG